MLRTVLAMVAFASAGMAQTRTHQVKLDEHTFTLPVGFTIEKVAARPLVDRPIVACFDDRGRLYVADSSGSNEKVAEQLKNPSHRIVRLEDTDGDGKFDKSTVFADKMMFPEGILWHRGHVYVGAPPHIWKLTDTDDDGKADKREIWFDGKTLTGCANDLHGPYLGPDGWIYWTKGAFAKQEYTLPNGKKFTTRASHIFRARPDGTGIEPVMTGGMDNPVDVAFLPNGERFFTTTFFQHPAAGQRDGLIHAVYGGIYGKDHDVIRDPDHKWTSPNLMPVMTHMGPAAPAGLHCYESDVFGPDFTTNLFACQFNLRKVSRHILKPHGATYKTEDSDFVVSDNTDFHPTDVIEDADGSLLIVNTGGWYKLCCPSSQLVKEDVLGAIYRVRRVGAIVPKDRWGNEVDWQKEGISELVYNLKATKAGPRFRNRVSENLVRFGDEAIENMLYWVFKDTDAVDELSWLLAIRIATQQGSALSRKLARSALAEVDRTDPKKDVIVQAAIHSIGLWRDKQALPILKEMLADKNLITRRMAAEAIGRIGDPSAIDSLVEAIGKTDDPILLHSMTFALIEIGDVKRTAAALKAPNDQTRRILMTVLDQLGEKLDPKILTEAVKSKDVALKETAFWIAGRHPELGGELFSEFASLIGAAISTAKTQADYESLTTLLSRFAHSKPVHAVIAVLAADRRSSMESRRAALRAMSRTGGKELSDTWASAIASALEDEATVASAISTLRAFPVVRGLNAEVLTEPLIAIVANSTQPDEVRLGALAVLPADARNKIRDKWDDFVLSSLNKDQPPPVRGLAAEVLSKMNLKPGQLDTLIAALPNVSPLDLDRVLAVFAQTKDEAIGKKLVAALNTPELRPALRADGVKERIKHFGPMVQQDAEKLYAELNKDYAAQRTKLDEVLKELPKGDIRRGQAVFNSAKASCIACHNIGYVGGKQGPDLTRIGGIRTERDLLESILFPSASFVRSYEPLTVVLKDGRQFSGVPKKDAPDEMILVLAADKEQRISRNDIEEVRPGKVSIMPAGLDKQLSTQELADLIAFLRNCK